MSMMGRFVQVSPDRLQQILADPSSVEAFLASAPVAPAAPKTLEVIRGMLQKRAPMIAASLKTMDPAMRERTEQALKAAGVDIDGLARGEGIEALAKLMAERGRVLAKAAGLSNDPPASGSNPQASGKGADLSIEKAWHGVHYLLCGKDQPGTDLVSQVVMGGTERRRRSRLRTRAVFQRRRGRRNCARAEPAQSRSRDGHAMGSGQNDDARHLSGAIRFRRRAVADGRVPQAAPILHRRERRKTRCRRLPRVNLEQAIAEEHRVDIALRRRERVA